MTEKVPSLLGLYEENKILKSALTTILELSYQGHPDGQGARLEMINRHAVEGLKRADAQGRE